MEAAPERGVGDTTSEAVDAGENGDTGERSSEATVEASLSAAPADREAADADASLRLVSARVPALARACACDSDSECDVAVRGVRPSAASMALSSSRPAPEPGCMEPDRSSADELGCDAGPKRNADAACGSARELAGPRAPAPSRLRAVHGVVATKAAPDGNPSAMPTAGSAGREALRAAAAPAA